VTRPRAFTADPERIAAALAGPGREVLVTLALQGRSKHRHRLIPVPRPDICPTCGQHRAPPAPPAATATAPTPT